MRDIRQIIQSKGELPAIPDTVLRIQRLLADPNVSFTKLAELMQSDPSIAGRVVQVSNSALYGGRSTISDVKQAIVRIGLQQARNIAYSVSVLELFSSVRGIDQKQFWKHCLAVGFLTQSICRVLRAGKSAEDMGYIAGLMHDVGVMVFAYLVPESYSELLSRISGDVSTLSDMVLVNAEEDAFRTTHAEVGALYVKHWWPVDEAVIDAIALHHDDWKDDISRAPFITQAVVAANHYCNARGVFSGVQIYDEKLDMEIFEILQMDEETFERFDDLAGMHIEMADLFIGGA